MAIIGVYVDLNSVVEIDDSKSEVSLAYFVVQQGWNLFSSLSTSTVPRRSYLLLATNHRAECERDARCVDEINSFAAIRRLLVATTRSVRNGRYYKSQLYGIEATRRR